MSLTDQLKENYPSLIEVKDHTHIPSHPYKFFRTSEDKIIGIAQEEMSEREARLLSAFMTPFEFPDFKLSHQERVWKEYLEGNTEDLILPSIPYKIRYVFFSLADQSLDTDDFQEALQALFPEEMPLIWQNSQEGFIIEEFFKKDQEPISFEMVIDILMSDFYTKLQFYISDEVYDINQYRRAFQWASRCSVLSKKYQPAEVVHFHDVTPYLFIDAIPAEDLASLQHSILSEAEEDIELLRTIRVFLESGSNTSLAAKLLFMHRNSLQYRVDKFIDKTGVDIKQFEKAAIVYLLLIYLNP
ncbi:helix-turn-helix domain-containing protein [Halobacillus sp. A1]|uniref:PucR family transcriptional regulator n=1 Tax=Halobacillus sp. A1 TaxID=2880262 RepID=UPI0020A67938|nr:helix-turn-helix domain-containing protein [Halobacillus sp. A1]MCP3033278.1 helix-turn-helix domain-containing protein [Halobacillus sp. A1]